MKWYQFSAKTDYNCGVVSLLVGMAAHSNPERFHEYRSGVKNREGKTILSRRGIELKKELKKKGVGVKDRYADEATLAVLAKEKKCDIIVYDNQYQEKWKFKGGSSDKRGRTAWRPPVEMQLSVGHFSTLLRWKDWSYEGHVVKGVERLGLSKESEDIRNAKQVEKQLSEDTIIYSRVCPKKERSRKLAAYDLEASPDDNAVGCVGGSKHFRTYGFYKVFYSCQASRPRCRIYKAC